MNPPHEQVLLVESDSKINDLIADQILRPLGYTVKVADSFDAALRAIESSPPGLIITGLDLNGLSGKDLLLALSSEGIDIPAILLSQSELDSDVLQTLRLGAEDCLRAPFRETEVVAAVERLLARGREERTRDRVMRQLLDTNVALKEQMRLLRQILAIGRILVSTRSPAMLFERIVDSAVSVSDAKGGWLLLRKDRSEVLWLMAARGLPPSRVERNRIWDDGISAGVIRSGIPLMTQEEMINLGGAPALRGAALCVPVKTEDEIVGTLAVFRGQSNPFTQKEEDLVKAVADFAAVALENASAQWTLKQPPPGR
jgi:CheY-like chemotaxis protein